MSLEPSANLAQSSSPEQRPKLEVAETASVENAGRRSRSDNGFPMDQTESQLFASNQIVPTDRRCDCAARLVAHSPEPSDDDVRQDVDTLLWSLRLHGVRRFYRQRFWETEAKEAEYADRIEPWPKLESVSEHSWHVADSVLLLAPHFGRLDRGRCLEMAILHDKLEILIGDFSPVGRKGDGWDSHAFDPTLRIEKNGEERGALVRYLARLRPSLRGEQCGLFEEVLSGKTREAKFVKAVDKLQAFAFVVTKKAGKFANRHLQFTLRYVEKGVGDFPGLWRHYLELRRRMVEQVAVDREKSVAAIEGVLGLNQQELLFPEEELWPPEPT